MKALDLRLAELERRRAPKTAKGVTGDIEELKARLRRSDEEYDRREQLPAREQLDLCLADYAQALKDRETRDPNRGTVCDEPMDAIRDKVHSMRVAELQARIDAEEAPLS